MYVCVWGWIMMNIYVNKKNNFKAALSTLVK